METVSLNTTLRILKLFKVLYLYIPCSFQTSEAYIYIMSDKSPSKPDQKIQLISFRRMFRGSKLQAGSYNHRGFPHSTPVSGMAALNLWHHIHVDN